MATNQDRPKVYRLQGLPDRPDFDRLAAAQFVASVINDPTVTADGVQIRSLATTVEPHKRWNCKVATVTFQHTPSALTAAEGADRWSFAVLGQTEPLILDSHFLGFTVLNDVSATEHRFDCIVLSGLASHPFGSWQPKGDDKSYMWIRDTLPTRIDGVRFILYGYDTTLKHSISFQTIADLANSLYLMLQTNGWESPSTKPLVFLAHSLGGVLLKQLLVMLAGANDSTQFMLSMIKGAMFFGTPSRGMPLGHLLTMVGDQPNRDLVEILSDTSEFLPNLESQFSGISHIQGMRLYWAYETKTSPTVQLVNGTYERSGPRSVMVDRQSATGNRALDLSFTIQIDKDHSDMVKLNLDDYWTQIIIAKIQEMCCICKAPQGMEPIVSSLNVVPNVQHGSDTNYGGTYLLEDERSSELVGWDYDLIISLLKAPERDQRYAQIDQNFGKTFSWAFENPSIGLAQWLRKGEGIFWINGKPGSGKSTFMKFLLEHNHTKELLRYWRSKPGSQIIANFFFHHRGTHLQKSFEGLLGSLLSQLLEGECRLHKTIGVLLSEKTTDLFETVQLDVDTFFQLCNVKSDSSVLRKRMATFLSENPSLRLQRIIKEQMSHELFFDGSLIKETLLRDFDSLSHAASNTTTYAAVENSICQRLLPKFSKHEKEIRIIIRKWCDSLNIFGRVQNFLREAQLNLQSQTNGQHINKLVERQRARQKLQIKVQCTHWKRSDLEEGLRRVFSQEMFDLNICLFFDALDEYVGNHEVISAFLKDSVRANSTSKTRTKILFSSRPWTIFRDNFDTCPSFSMQEHTSEDIQEYCAGSLPDCSRSKALIRPFMNEIAHRARGVFIWVKLVMEDLTALATTTDGADEVLSQKLRQCLDSLPDELEDYYATIIHRLPTSTRRQSYILFECLSKSSTTITLEHVPSLLACGMSNYLHEAQGIIECKSAPGSEDPEGHVRTISGGMVDIVPWREPPSVNIPPDWGGRHGVKMQLMHQTVNDWVELPTFKHIILGNRANMIAENGHSFLVKFYTHQLRRESEAMGITILDHAIKAEMTTGVSQYMYLSRLPGTIRAHLVNYGPVMQTNVGRKVSFNNEDDVNEIYQVQRLDSDRHINRTKEDRSTTSWPRYDAEIERLSGTAIPVNAGIPGIVGGPAELGVPGDLPKKTGHLEMALREDRLSPRDSISGLKLAASGGLSLYLRDAVQHDKSVFRQSNEPLVSILLYPVRYQSAVQHSDTVRRRLWSAKFMIENGFRLHLCRGNLPLVFYGIWRSPDQETSQMYTDLILTAVQNGLPVATRFGIGLSPGNPTSLLHLSPPILAEYLLKKGVNPNILNTTGQTPLDYILDSDSVFQKCPFGLDWLHGTLQVLIWNGARQRKGTRHSQRLKGQKLLQRLDGIGYDTSRLQSLQIPSLAPDEESSPPLEPGNATLDASGTYVGQQTSRSILARIFRRSGVDS